MFGDHRRGWVRRLLGNRALLHFGMVSYGVYLWHLAWIIQLVHWDLGEHEVIGPWFTWLPIVVGGAWILGSLSYYIVERPALSLEAARPRPAAGAVAGARAVSSEPYAQPSFAQRLREHARVGGRRARGGRGWRAGRPTWRCRAAASSRWAASRTGCCAAATA